MRSGRISVIAAVRHGRRGWLLRWREGATYYKNGHMRAGGRALCSWFPDRDEAIAVRDHLRAGRTLDDAFRLMKQVA